MNSVQAEERYRKGADSMYRNGVILLIVLFCVACLISCGKKEVSEPEKSEFVRIETGENSPVFMHIS